MPVRESWAQVPLDLTLLAGEEEEEGRGLRFFFLLLWCHVWCC